jgi:CheY-like chemotaxis protein
MMALEKRPVALVVEDETLIRMSAVDMLEDADFDVVEAANAQQALGILAANDKIALVFTDINMPGALDGLDVAREASRRHPDIHVILTSGKTRPPPSAIPEHGIFIDKPYSVDSLSAAVKSLMH